MGIKRYWLAVNLCVLGLLLNTAQATPQIQHWQTDSGARVYFVPVDDIPMVDVRIVFDAGSARDGFTPRKLAGTALMTNGLLAEGAAGKSAQQLAENFAAVGAVFSNGALKDMAWLSLRSLREDKYLQPALSNLQAILNHPDFPAQAFRRERERLKIAVKAKKQSPGAIASERFYQELYGSHPYASPSEGTEQTLRQLRRSDLQQFYQQYYVARNAVISVVGQLSRAQAEQLVAQLLSDLPAGQAAATLPPVQLLSEAKTVQIDFPSAQSTVLMGQVGMARGDADYFALYLANHAFGGSGFGSRLMDEVREKRGLAYSTYSYFSPMAQAGPFQIGLQTRNDQVKQTLQVVRQALHEYIVEGPGEDELQDSLKNITGGFPLRIDSNKKIVEYLSMIGFYQLPLDYLDTFVSRINQQSRDQVHAALQRRLHEDKMLTIIVGGNQSQGDN